MLIDFHTHILPPAFRRQRDRLLERDATFRALFSGPRAIIATAEDLIATLDEAGLDAAVALGYGWTDAAVARESNDYLLQSAAGYPGRIIPFCCVNPAWGEAALREVERCAGLGARGIGELHPDTQGFMLADVSVMGPLMELARAHRLVVLTHASEPVGHVYPGKGSATPGVLLPFIQQHAGTPIVCAHWGGGLPFYALMPEVRQALSAAYVDTAVSPFLYDQAVFSLAPKLIGADHVLFGSDFPLLKPSRVLAQARAAGLSDADLQAILGGNAQRLLGIVDPQPPIH